MITSYVIEITGDPFPYTGPSLNLTTDGSYPDNGLKSLEVTGLEEYNEYNISIAAVNSEGTGPYTTGDIQRTNQAGKSRKWCNKPLLPKKCYDTSHQVFRSRCSWYSKDMFN